jgi:hypothetical protein
VATVCFHLRGYARSRILRIYGNLAALLLGRR